MQQYPPQRRLDTMLDTMSPLFLSLKQVSRLLRLTASLNEDANKERALQSVTEIIYSLVKAGQSWLTFILFTAITLML